MVSGTTSSACMSVDCNRSKWVASETCELSTTNITACLSAVWWEGYTFMFRYYSFAAFYAFQVVQQKRIPSIFLQMISSDGILLWTWHLKVVILAMVRISSGGLH